MSENSPHCLLLNDYVNIINHKGKVPLFVSLWNVASGNHLSGPYDVSALPIPVLLFCGIRQHRELGH